VGGGGNKRAGEGVERGTFAIELDVYTCRSICYPAVQLRTRSELIDKGAKADALHDAAHMYSTTHKNPVKRWFGQCALFYHLSACAVQRQPTRTRA
jgi:hypothetical protein